VILELPKRSAGSDLELKYTTNHKQNFWKLHYARSYWTVPKKRLLPKNNFCSAHLWLTFNLAKKNCAAVKPVRQIKIFLIRFKIL